jgi:hypothetical protein
MNCNTCDKVKVLDTFVNCPECRSKKRLDQFLETHYEIYPQLDSNLMSRLMTEKEIEYIKSIWSVRMTSNNALKLFKKYIEKNPVAFKSFSN